MIGTDFYIYENVQKYGMVGDDLIFDFWCLTPLSAIFQLYHGDKF
jgi:hypothetical protein